MSGLSGLEPVRGKVHLYTGDGKGKTTAAAGLAVRALGAGKTVLFCQFMKSGGSGELDGLEKLGAKLLIAGCGGKFRFQMDESEKERLAGDQERCFSEASRRVMDGEAEVAVLDEAVDAVNCGAVSIDRLLELIAGRPEHVELVITGRDPGERLCEASDYHTEFICKRHPYGKGVPARRGIEY